MNFPTSVLCNEAGQGVLKKKVRDAVNSLNRDWNFCSYSFEGKLFSSVSLNVSFNFVASNCYWCSFVGTRECKDLDIDVQCDHRVRTTRETNEEDGGTYIISAVVPAEP